MKPRGDASCRRRRCRSCQCRSSSRRAWSHAGTPPPRRTSRPCTRPGRRTSGASRRRRCRPRGCRPACRYRGRCTSCRPGAAGGRSPRRDRSPSYSCCRRRNRAARRRRRCRPGRSRCRCGGSRRCSRRRPGKFRGRASPGRPDRRRNTRGRRRHRPGRRQGGQAIEEADGNGDGKRPAAHASTSSAARMGLRVGPHESAHAVTRRAGCRSSHAAPPPAD